ncbi:MAG: peptidase M20 [Acidobacteria bacterium]|nr:MAG: peptidase M20 [Acidobacteriota bacterium]
MARPKYIPTYNRLIMHRAAILAASVAAVCAVAVGGVFAQSETFDASVRAILKELIEINTTESAGNTTRAAEAMAGRLRDAGFSPNDVQVIGPTARKGNLVARFRRTGARRPVLLLAHLDVVEAKREDWSFDPFTLLEKDGYFYGRGTSDDKGMAAQFMANLIRLKQERFVPDRDLILALTADEEGGDSNGVLWLLANHRDLIDAELAINEGGGGVARSGKYLVVEVQAAEKVYQDFRLEVHNGGGHSSLPIRNNAIARLAAGLTRLGAFEFPVRLTDTTRAYFERSAIVQADAQTAKDMRSAAKGTDQRAAARLAAASPYFNAMMRTTCVPTRLEGGHANNALPQLAAAILNCRLLPGDSPDEVRRRLVEVVADPQISVTFVGTATPSNPAPLVPELMETVDTMTRSMFPGVVVVPVMSTGATDGLYLRNAGIPTFGVDATFADLDDVRAHGRDERVGVKQYFEGLEFQYRLIKMLSVH